MRSWRSLTSGLLFGSRVALGVVLLLAVGTLDGSAFTFQAGTRGRVEIKAPNSKTGVVETHTLYGAGKSYALLIGNSVYQKWPALTEVPGELERVRAALEKQSFAIYGGRVWSNLTGKQLEDTLREFVKAYALVGDARLVVFYSGHGDTRETLSGRDMGYLVGIDAPSPDDDEAEFVKKSVSMKTVKSLAEQLEVRHALFLFDCCCSGAIFFTKGGRPKPEERLSDRVLNPVTEIITAGGAKEKVPAQSVFARAFAGVLDNGLTDDADGYLTGLELADYLKTRVASETGNTVGFGQIVAPGKIPGDIVFVSPGARARVVEPAPRDPVPMRLTGTLEVWSKRAAWITVGGGNVYSVPAGQMLSFAKTPIGVYSIRGWGSAEQAGRGQPGFEQKVELAPDATVRVEVTIAAVAPTDGSPTGKRWVNSIGQGLVRIEPGTFMMGSPTGEDDRDDDEVRHRVTLTRVFYMSEYETRQKDYESVMGSNPSHFKGAKRPVERVSYGRALEYCRRLTSQEREAGKIPRDWEYSLPTEAEWEYACRAGTTTTFHYGDSLSSTQANFDGNYPYGGAAKSRYIEGTVDVGSYRENAWGLYDMHGNVWEWCLDRFGPYPIRDVTDPRGPSSGEFRVGRGGSWSDFAGSCRSADRGWFSPGSGYINLGFRVVLVSSESR